MTHRKIALVESKYAGSNLREWGVGEERLQNYAGYLLILFVGTNALPSPLTASASQMERFGIVYRQDCPTLGKKDQLE